MRRVEIHAWLFGDGGDAFLKGALYGSFVFFLLILNRWLVTDLGLLSFGRVWQYYVSYADIGFVRRALLGSALSYSKLNTLIKNEYIFTLVFSSVCGAFSYVLTYRIMRHGVFTRAFVLSVAFSPAFLLHFGYANGSLDLPVLVVALGAILFIDNLSVVSGLVVIGILIHEVFVFLIPTILVLRWDARVREASAPRGRKDLVSFVAIAVASIGTYAALKHFGVAYFDRNEYYHLMAQRIPNAAYKIGLWSGYCELFSPLSDNIVDVPGYVRNNINSFAGVLSLLTVIYAVHLTCLCAWKNQKFDGFGKSLVIGAALFPLLIMLVATDFLRWASFSGTAALLALVTFVKKGYVTVRPFHNYIMLGFCTLSPFGMIDMGYPFPIVFFIWNKALRLLTKYWLVPA